MSKVPENLKYTEEHEWILVEGNKGKVGITDYAQDALGDVVFVDLPDEGDELEKDDIFGAVESVKAASDLFTPVSGKVIKVNEKLEESPELVNESPYEEGWMIEIEIKDKDELNDLLSWKEYEKILEDD